jgi:hypothetical protein
MKFNVSGNASSPVMLNISREHELPELFASLGFTAGAEIGVERGVYSKQLCKKVPGLKLYCIDPWVIYPGYREHVSQEKLDAFYEETIQRLVPFGCSVIRNSSMGAVTDFPDDSLDFVYIDGNHDFIRIAQDLNAWIPKVRKGGIVAGHDFKRVKGDYVCHVKDVVQAWAYSHDISMWFVTKLDSSPSWFWVKQ